MNFNRNPETMTAERTARAIRGTARPTEPHTPSQPTEPPPITREMQNDPRLPAPGSVIIREYKGCTIRVVVLEDGEGFEYEGERYPMNQSSIDIVTSRTPQRLTPEPPSRKCAMTVDSDKSNMPENGPASHSVGWSGGVDLSILALLVSAIWTGSLLGAIGGLIAWLAFGRSFLVAFAVIWLAYFLLLCARRILQQ